MATDHLAVDPQISAPPPAGISATDPSTDAPLLDNPTTTVAPTAHLPKRQRRPSVRLGDLGGENPSDAPQRRPNRTWRFHKDPSLAAKSSKTRPLTNLVNGGAATDSNFQDFVDLSDNYAGFTHRKPKIRKPARRARTNWNKFDSATITNGAIETPNFLQEAHNNNEEFREFEAAENSESPKDKQQSPINSAENMGLQFWDRHRRGSNGLHHNEVNSSEKLNKESLGVREWLMGLGLGRYAPVFEIHEVDDEVLPMLTPEDLKDMGITAVGSRRKMYSAILKLRRGLP